MPDDPLSQPRPLTLQDLKLLLSSIEDLDLQPHEMILIGSTAAMAWTSSPSSLTTSYDIVLVSPLHNVQLLVNTAFGPESSFFQQHGFYAQVVGEWPLKKLPDGWKDRAARLDIPDVDTVIFAIHPHDIALNKAIAHRPKDLLWLGEAFRSSILSLNEFRSFVAQSGVDEPTQINVTRSLFFIPIAEHRDQPSLSADYLQLDDLDEATQSTVLAKLRDYRDHPEALLPFTILQHLPEAHLAKIPLLDELLSPRSREPER